MWVWTHSSICTAPKHFSCFWKQTAMCFVYCLRRSVYTWSLIDLAHLSVRGWQEVDRNSMAKEHSWSCKTSGVYTHHSLQDCCNSMLSDEELFIPARRITIHVRQIPSALSEIIYQESFWRFFAHPHKQHPLVFYPLPSQYSVESCVTHTLLVVNANYWPGFCTVVAAPCLDS